MTSSCVGKGVRAMPEIEIDYKKRTAATSTSLWSLFWAWVTGKAEQ